jgi:hypothetical protein
VSDAGLPPLLLDAHTVRQVAQTLDVGVAVVDSRTWAILFENASFFRHFPPGADADAPLTERLGDLNT